MRLQATPRQTASAPESKIREIVRKPERPCKRPVWVDSLSRRCARTSVTATPPGREPKIDPPGIEIDASEPCPQSGTAAQGSPLPSPGRSARRERRRVPLRPSLDRRRRNGRP